jgi:hypothetical protein
MLGCQSNTVARWERGALKPGPIQLVRLRDLAQGDDKAPFEEELKRQFGSNPPGHVWMFTPEESGWKPLGRDELAERAGWKRVSDPPLTAEPVLAEIVLLWETYKSDPKAVKHFQDALGFLRVQLAGRKTPVAEKPSDPPAAPPEEPDGPATPKP